jgi:hypothetical protein
MAAVRIKTVEDLKPFLGKFVQLQCADEYFTLRENMLYAYIASQLQDNFVSAVLFTKLTEPYMAPISIKPTGHGVNSPRSETCQLVVRLATMFECSWLNNQLLVPCMKINGSQSVVNLVHHQLGEQLFYQFGENSPTKDEVYPVYKE